MGPERGRAPHNRLTAAYFGYATCVVVLLLLVHDKRVRFPKVTRQRAEMDEWERDRGERQREREEGSKHRKSTDEYAKACSATRKSTVLFVHRDRH